MDRSRRWLGPGGGERLVTASVHGTLRRSTRVGYPAFQPLETLIEGDGPFALSDAGAARLRTFPTLLSARKQRLTDLPPHSSAYHVLVS